jgi:16S rRNA (cytosine967-C5)-methyltransferase
VRQTVEGLAELNAKQRSILDAAATLLKPGGRLVYGTCSLLAEENEEIVKDFLSRHPDFSLLPAKDVLDKLGLKVKGAGDYLHLYPHVHDTDGFFAAVLVKGK